MHCNSADISPATDILLQTELPSVLERAFDKGANIAAVEEAANALLVSAGNRSMALFGVMTSIRKMKVGDENADMLAKELKLDARCTALLQTALQGWREKMLVRVGVIYICALQQMQTFHLQHVIDFRLSSRPSLSMHSTKVRTTPPLKTRRGPSSCSLETEAWTFMA